jgi:hypothetical protein
VGLSAEEAIKANRVTAPFQYRTFQIVVEDNTRYALPCFKGGDVSAQEVLHASVEEAAQEDLTGVAQHHDEGHQRAACPTDFEMAEMSPVDLSFFPGKRAQTQIGFGFRARPVAGDQVAEVVRAATIASAVGHDVQAAGGQRRECLQRLADEWQIRVDL